MVVGTQCLILRIKFKNYCLESFSTLQMVDKETV